MKPKIIWKNIRGSCVNGVTYVCIVFLCAARLMQDEKGGFSVEYIRAFLVGGLICVVGQILIDRTKLTPARIMVLYVTAGVVLGGLGLYEPFAEFAGAGATTPLCGFGWLLSDGVKKAVEEKGLLGALTGGLTAGAAGITAAVVFAFLAALIAKPKDKT